MVCVLIRIDLFSSVTVAINNRVASHITLIMWFILVDYKVQPHFENFGPAVSHVFVFLAGRAQTRITHFHGVIYGYRYISYQEDNIVRQEVAALPSVSI